MRRIKDRLNTPRNTPAGFARYLVALAKRPCDSQKDCSRKNMVRGESFFQRLACEGQFFARGMMRGAQVTAGMAMGDKANQCLVPLRSHNERLTQVGEAGKICLFHTRPGNVRVNLNTDSRYSSHCFCAHCTVDTVAMFRHVATDG